MSRTAGAACAVALLALTAAGADTERIKTGIRFRAAGSLSVAGGRIGLARVYGQEGAEPIAFEAEAASSLELQSSSAGLVHDPDVSGEYCIHHVKAMAFRFAVTTPGPYRVWYRSWFPLKADYNHSEYMDDPGDRQQVHDSMGGALDAKQWHWVKGPLYELTNGMHEYVFPSPTAFCGGARLDRVILMPNDRNLTNPASIPNAKVLSGETGETVSSSVRLRRIVEWTVDYRTTGAVDIYFSYDRGTTWTLFTGQPGDSVSVPDTARDGRLRFKVSMTATPESPAPSLDGFVVHVERAEQQAQNKVSR